MKKEKWIKKLKRRTHLFKFLNTDCLKKDLNRKIDWQKVIIIEKTQEIKIKKKIKREIKESEGGPDKRRNKQRNKKENMKRREK